MSDLQQIPQPEAQQPDPSTRLEGWDNIAHYLGVHKRTARAWQDGRGLPVHQFFGKGGRVYALTTELDEWRAHSAARAGDTSTVEPDTDQPSVEMVSPETEPASAQPPLRKRWTLVAASVGLAALLFLSARQVWTRYLPYAPPASSPGRLLAHLSSEGGRLDLIPVGSSPCNAVLAPDGARIFVANCQGGSLSVIDTATGRVSHEIPLGPEPESMALDAVSRRLYVGTFWNGISVVDVETSKVIDTIPVEGPITDLAIAQDHILYVARRERGLSAILPANHRLTPIPVTTMPMFLATSPDGALLYISYQGSGPGGRVAHDALDVYDTRTHAFVAGISGPLRVGGRLAVTSNGILLADGSNACFAAEYKPFWGECPAAPGSIFSLVRATDNRVIGTLGYPSGPSGALGVFPGGSRAYTANQAVRVFDTSGLNVLETFPLDSVRRILFAPDGKRAWAVVQDQNSVAVLNTDHGACAKAPRGLSGWWPGDGASDDIRGSGDNGRLEGSVTYARALVGQGFAFDGAGYMSLGTLENLGTVAPDFTAMAWVKFSATGSGEQAIFDRLHSGRPRDGGFRLSRGGDGRLKLTALNAAQVSVTATATGPTPNGVWIHIVAVRSIDSIALYVNGSRSAVQHLPGPSWNTPGSGEVRLGAFPEGGGFLHGVLDEFQWYNRALEQSEIASVVSAREYGVCER